MAKQILRNTEIETSVKFWGTGTESIDLQTDLIIPNRLVLDGATQRVNIMSFTWAGPINSSATITRNGVNIITLDGSNAGQLVFDNMFFNDSVENSSDISVTLVGGITLYVVLKKQSGYKVTFESNLYGVYDNPNIVDTPINPNP